MLIPDHLKFSLIVSNADFIVRDHQLHGVRAVPGVTFLDLIYRYLKMKGIDTRSVEVRNMLFLEPVVTSAEYDQKIEVTIDRHDGCWKLEARSRKWKNGNPAGNESSQNMKAELHPAAPLPVKTIDPLRLAKLAHTVADMDDCYQYSRKSGLMHYDEMKLQGQVYLGDGYVLGDARLSASSARHLDQFLMHPAFLDGSLSVPCLMILNKVEVDYGQAKPFIPIYIESFQTLGSFGSHCYVYTEDRRITLSPSQDIMYMDIEIYNEKGVLTAAYTKFSAKRVRSDSGIRQLQQRAASIVIETANPGAPAPRNGYCMQVPLRTQRSAVELADPPASSIPGQTAAVEQIIAELAAEMLETEEGRIGREDDFYTLGLDSRHLLQMAEKLEQMFAVELYPTLLFEYNTVRKLSEYFSALNSAAIPAPIPEVALELFQGQLPVAVQEGLADGQELYPGPEQAGSLSKEHQEAVGGLEARLVTELCGLVGQMLDCEAAAVDIDSEFYELGLDSRHLLQLVEQLEACYTLSLYPTLLFEHTDIRKLAGYLATVINTPGQQVIVPDPEPGQTISPAAASAGLDSGVKASGGVLEQATDGFYYYPGWVPAPVIQPGAEGRGQNVGPFLVVYSEESEHLAHFLTRIYSPAASFSLKLTKGRTMKISPAEWEADASDPEAIRRIVPELGAIAEIFFLGGLTGDRGAGGFADAVAQNQLYGIVSLFRLVQALDQARWFAMDKRITIVTRQAVRVLPDEQVYPFGAALHGFVKSLSKEQPQSEFVLVDMDDQALRPERSQDERMELVHRLRGEAAQKNGEMIAFRGARKYIQIIERAKMAPSLTAFRERGVYLIVGGAGGIGLELGRYLSSRYKARLVLTGRSEATDLQQRSIAELERLGGQAEYIQADATDIEAMRRVVLHTEKRYGNLNGAVHSAIVLEDVTIRRMEEDALLRVLSPKVKGSTVMYEVLKDKPMDFMLFFSSSQSFMANFGQSNYAGGCSFKDALSAYWNQNAASPAVTINWGYWGSVGIVAKEEYYRKITASGVLSIEPEEGMRTIEAALSCGSEQLIAVKIEAGLHEQHGIDPMNFVTQYSALLPSIEPEIVQQLEGELHRGSYQGKGHVDPAMEEYESFQNKLALSYFQQAGYFRQAGETHYIPDLLRKLGVIEAYGRMAVALMDILVRAGYVAVEELRATALLPADVHWQKLNADQADLEREKHRLAAVLPELAPHIELLWICVQAYPSVLSGVSNYMTVMFPKGSTRLVEKIYQGNAVTDYYNSLVAEAVLTYVIKRLELDPAAAITILEVGAGTGGTSRFVLEAVRPYSANITYLFTDLALDFTPAKDQQFHSLYPNVSFQTLDIEEDPEPQGIAPGSCDLIFASNALHATRNIVPSLNNAKKALKKNGLLIVNESTELNDFVTLTFGLTTGWWLYEDEAVRIKESPLLKQETWLQLMLLSGFKGGRSLGLSESLYKGQRVIIAESDGCHGTRISREWKSALQAGLAASSQYGTETGAAPQDEYHHAEDQTAAALAVVEAAGNSEGSAGTGPPGKANRVDKSKDQPGNQSASIEILGIDDGELGQSFAGRWLDMKKGAQPGNPSIDLAKEYIRLSGSKRRKTIHMLVETPLSGKMEVVTSGKGRTILLINGFGLTAPQWLHQLNAWSADYRVTVIHIPGCGLSVTRREQDLEGLGAAFMDTLEALECEWPVHVVGLSWGGMAAQAIAARYPEKIASLVLVNTFEQYRQGEQSLRDTMQADFEKQGNNGSQLVFDSEFMNGQVREWGEMAKRGFDTAAYIPLIEAPTLLIAGGGDTVIDPAASRSIAEKIRTAEYYEIRGAGHVPNVTHADEFNLVVMEFIRKQDVLRDFVAGSLVPEGKRIVALEEREFMIGCPSMTTPELHKREGRDIRRINITWEAAGGRQEVSAFRKVFSVKNDAPVPTPPKSIRKRMVANALRMLENGNGFKVYEKEASRELVLMQSAELGMQPFCPKLYGTKINENGGETWMLLENLWQARDGLDGSGVNNAWSAAEIEAVLEGLADMHSIHYNRTQFIPGEMGLGVFDAKALRASGNLIQELLKLNANRHPGLIQQQIHTSLSEFTEKLPGHAARMAAAPMTLTHNDCAPWNMCLRATGSVPQLVMYNWEYAKLQNPQKDLAQFLLLTVDNAADSKQFIHYVDCYFSRLREKTGTEGRLDQFLDVLYSNLMEFVAIRLQMSLLTGGTFESGAAKLAFSRLPGMLHRFETLRV